jgi:hypothetical protein
MSSHDRLLILTHHEKGHNPKMNLIVELVFSEDKPAIKAKLQALRLTLTEADDGTWVIDNPNHPTRVGLHWDSSDYTTRAVQLAMALTGIYWPFAFPKLLSEINARWAIESKKRKAASPPPEPAPKTEPEPTPEPEPALQQLSLF